MKYIIQVPTKVDSQNFVKAIQELNEEKLLIFANDQIKIYPYDEKEDQIIVTHMDYKSAIRLIMLEQKEMNEKMEKERLNQIQDENTKKLREIVNHYDNVDDDHDDDVKANEFMNKDVY